MMRVLAIISLCLFGSASWAAVESSQRPVQRPETGAPAQSEPFRTARGVLGFSLRPFLRPRKAERAGRQQHQLRREGAICGDRAIQGDAIGQVDGGTAGGCGVEDAVRVRSVSGVSLSRAAIMDCTTAAALKSWIEDSAKPVLRRTGGGLSQVHVAAHYACRTRNNQKGRRVSEHGKGRAIDIAGFTFADGSQISVLEGWSNRRYGRSLKRLHRQACGPFGTVLGPDADKFHRDHFHLDTARYRNGTYCR